MDVDRIRRIAPPAALAVTALVGASFWFSGDGDDGYMRRLAARGELPPPGYDQLTEELAEVRRAWMPRERERTLQRIERRAGSLQAPMLWVLARTGHPLYTETAQLAAIAGMESAYPLLESAALSAPPAVRVTALQAAEQLQPWPLDELAGLLRHEDDPVVLAGVLGICRGRDPQPVHEIVELLEFDSEEVRLAALAALPEELPEEAVRAMMLWTMFGASDSQVALRALTRSIGDPEVRKRLIEQLADATPAAQIDILDALGEQGESLAVADRVWQMVVDDRLGMDLRLAAMRCLQHTDSCDLATISGELDRLPLPLRLQAVRSLIAVGDRDGLAALVRMGDESVEARRLLAQISGIRIHRGMDAYREWFDDLTEIPALPLR